MPIKSPELLGQEVEHSLRGQKKDFGSLTSRQEAQIRMESEQRGQEVSDQVQAYRRAFIREGLPVSGSSAVLSHVFAARTVENDALAEYGLPPRWAIDGGHSCGLPKAAEQPNR